MRPAPRSAADPHASPPAATDDPKVVRAVVRILGLIGGLQGAGVRARIAIALILTIAAKLVAVVAPLVLADGVNKLAAGQAEGLLPTFMGFAALWAGLRLFSAVGPQIRDAIFSPVSEEAQRRAGTRVFTHVHALSLRYHQSKRTGSLQRTIERGVRAIDFLLRFLAFNIAPTIFELGLAAVLMAIVYGPMFGAIAAATVLIYAWGTIAVTNWRLQHRRAMNELDNEASGRAVDSFLNFETVKSFAAEDREAARFDAALVRYAKAAVRANTSLVALNVLQAVVMNIGLAAMVAAAGYVVTQGRMGPGDITAVILIMLNLYAPLNILGMAYREIKQSAIDTETMFQLLDERPDVADKPDARTLSAPKGEVHFINVGFVHEGRDTGLRGVSFVAPAGKTTAIVGASGSGKSTILKLLMRFYDPSEGAIEIDGEDIRDVTQKSLRAQIGLVPQDVVLFNDTIGFNIAYGRPDATPEAVREAAERAQLAAFIDALPQGYETRVGERGLKLSGGEKQRVGIARVVLRNPKILILDEATSSLDSRTEAEVQLALEDVAQGRTTVVVAHRLSTIASADQILVVKDGAIVERGAHAALAASGGEYAALWKRQAESPDAARV
jgi:ABC-type transport system involved in Fe-S cluster assembly fused permease/ATPase subunit